MNIKVGTRFIFKSSNGLSYQYDVINVNTFREPSSKYGAAVKEVETGLSSPDLVFFDDEWLYIFSDRIEVV